MAKKKQTHQAQPKAFSIPADLAALGGAYINHLVPSMRAEHSRRLAQAAKRVKLHKPKKA